MSGRGWFWSGVILLLAVATVGLALARADGNDGPTSPDAPADASASAEGTADGAISAEAAGSARVSDWLEIPARTGVPFERLDGSEVHLGEFRGRVVVLNFWGTWCPPCRREIPDLVQLQEALPEGRATVIGVAIQSGSPEDIRAFAGEFGINYPIWISDSQTALSNFTAIGYPYTLLIDQESVIRKQYLGPQTYETLATDIEHLTEWELPEAPPVAARAEG